jgi:hypothetical protein
VQNLLNDKRYSQEGFKESLKAKATMIANLQRELANANLQIKQLKSSLEEEQTNMKLMS